VVADPRREEIAHPGKVHPAGEPGQAEKLLDLGREGDAVRGGDGIERLDAEAVARRKQARLPRVPDQEGPHAPEAAQAILAPLGVGREQHLAVGAAAEGVAACLHLLPQLEVIVDLAVEDEVEAAARIPASERSRIASRR